MPFAVRNIGLGISSDTFTLDEIGIPNSVEIFKFHTSFELILAKRFFINLTNNVLGDSSRFQILKTTSDLSGVFDMDGVDLIINKAEEWEIEIITSGTTFQNVVFVVIYENIKPESVIASERETGAIGGFLRRRRSR